MKEANYLVKHRRVWVHIAKRPGASDEIASICAVTRESDTVSSITKVYTSPNWRKMGCARRLVSFVCETWVNVFRFRVQNLILCNQTAED